jgi:hypothetical protein
MVAFTIRNETTGSEEQAVFSCDYNGWADVPEEEREGIEAFEAAQLVLALVVRLCLVFESPPIALDSLLEPRAA